MTDIEERILEFNRSLTKNYNLLDYTHQMLREFFHGEVDSKLVDDLVNLSSSKFVTNFLLVHFGIIKNTESYYTMKLINSYRFIEGIDYQYIELREGPLKPIFTVKAFMLCLIEYKKNDRYNKLYIFLFYCIFIYYKDYQYSLELRAKDDELASLRSQLGTFRVKSRTLPSTTSNAKSHFVLLRRNKNYHVIYGYNDDIYAKLQTYMSKYADSVKVLHINNCKNASELLRLIKRQICDEKGVINMMGANFYILPDFKYSEKELIHDIVYWHEFSKMAP